MGAVFGGGPPAKHDLRQRWRRQLPHPPDHRSRHRLHDTSLALTLVRFGMAWLDDHARERHPAFPFAQPADTTGNTDDEAAAIADGAP